MRRRFAGSRTWRPPSTARPSPFCSPCAAARAGPPCPLTLGAGRAATARHAPALGGRDIPDAAGLADGLRAADVRAPGSVLEFAPPIVRAAVYESIPAGERALAHAEAARLLERDGADAERVALHLLHSEPGGSAQVGALLRAAAQAANGRAAPGAAADY